MSHRLSTQLPRNWGENILAQLSREYGHVPTMVMLNADWSRAWNGWEELRADLLVFDSLPDPDAFIEAAAMRTQSCLRQFLRLAINNRDVESLTEAQRLSQLREAPYHLEKGCGSVHGRNDCCADSLLQLLVDAGFLSNLSEPARERACLRNREALCQHENAALRPRRRDPVTNRVICEDGGAYLEHDVHAEPTINFFMEHLRDKVLRPLPEEGLRVNVYSRLDSAEIPHSSIRVCRRSAAGDANVVLHMYNLTGGGISGYHYDPMFRIRPEAGGEASITSLALCSVRSLCMWVALRSLVGS